MSYAHCQELCGTVRNDGSDSNNPQSSVHPSYSSSDADLILSSNDGVQFHVHSFIMRRGSEFFRTMLELPRSSMSTTNTVDIIAMDESADILAHLLSIIYPDGEGFPSFPSFDYAIRLFAAADKYEMKKAMGTIRHLIMLPNAGQRPLELYVIACKFGWEQEAKLASTWSLDFNIDTPESLEVLWRLDHLSDLLKLQVLHRKRKQKFVNDLPYLSLMNDGLSGRCGRPSHSRQLHSSAKGYLRFILMTELENCPSGATLGRDSFWDDDLSSDLATLWSFRCSSCDNPLFDQTEMAGVFRLRQNLMPSTI